MRAVGSASLAVRTGRPPQESDMYEVIYGEDTIQHPTRAEAISAAKEISAENARGMIQVQDQDRRERMTYQNGELISYDYETRRS